MPSHEFELGKERRRAVTEGDRPRYCGGCGSIAQAGGRFCGVCGAKIPDGAQPAAPTGGSPVLVQEPQQVARTRGSGPRRPRWIVPLALLIVVIASTGAVAYAALAPGSDLLGASGQQPPEVAGEAPPQEDRPEVPPSPDGEPTTTPVSRNAPPDPAFDLLLPTLKERTAAPIMLPAELPNEFENVAVDADLEGEGYGVLFLMTPSDEIVQRFVRARTLGTLEALPQSEPRENEYFEATSTESVELPDGTEATLSYMEPVGQGGTQGPYWEGEFDRDGTTYRLTVVSEAPDEDAIRRVLSTMVEVRGPVEEAAQAPPGPMDDRTPEAQAPGPVDPLEVEQAAGDYYRAAGVEDWDYTYDNLDSETQALFTMDEWRKKNGWFANNGTTIYHIESVRLNGSSREPLAEVDVRLTGEDGSSSVRTTYFVREDGEWRHRFGREETDLFMPDATYEEFVEAQEG